MKKIFAIITAFVLVFSLAACGGSEESAPEADTTVNAVAGAEDDITLADAAEADTTVADAATDAAEADTTAADATTAANAEMTKAEFVKFLNAETAKIAKNGKYSLVRKCTYTRAVNVGSQTATDIINDIIKGIDENSSLDSVIGHFLGMGTTQGNIPKDDIKNDYKIAATSLKEADLGSFTASDGVYSFTLAKATDPKKNGTTPFSRFTRDFVTHEEVVTSIAEFTGAITVKETDVNYWNIKAQVKVEDGKITSISYSYDFDATLAVTALFVTISGDGAAVNNTTYSNIKY